MMKVNEYNVCIKPQERDTCTYINVVAVPTICSRIIDHGKKVAIEKHSILKKLKLANRVNLSNEEIDMLIGADNYWKLVSNDNKNDDDSGEAINSSFGWPRRNEAGIAC